MARIEEDEMTCDNCGKKTLEGDYVKWDDWEFYCEDCLQEITDGSG